MSARSEAQLLARLQAIATELTNIKSDAVTQQRGGLAGNVDQALSYLNASITSLKGAQPR